MTTTLVRIYADNADATAVVEALEQARYAPIVVSGAGPDGAARSQEDVVSELAGIHYFLKSDAELFARAIAAGGTFVALRPHFGTAVKATAILDSAASVDLGLPDESDANTLPWDDAAPFSSALQWRTLIDHHATESAPWNLGPLLVKSGPLFSWFGFPLLSEDSAPLSKAIGQPVLLEDPAPLSTLLKLPTLI